MFRPSTTEIDKIVDRVEQRAVARRDASTRGAELAVRLAIVGGVGALAARIGLHCADRALDHRPLEATWSEAWRRSPRASSTSAMPPHGRPEIGAMITTLGHVARQPDRA